MARAKATVRLAPDLPADLAGWTVLLDHGAIYAALRRAGFDWNEALDSVDLARAVESRGSGWRVLFDHRHPPPDAARARQDTLVLEGMHPAIGAQTMTVQLAHVRLAWPAEVRP